jgi:TPR repeat protein
MPERNPLKASDHFHIACSSNHAPSCYNLAVLYKNGDTGVPKDEAKFEYYRNRTNELVNVYGGLGGRKMV